MNKSAKTSINKNKVPYLFTHTRLWKVGSTNLDIGGGKYDTATKYLDEKYSITNVIYDPYNRTEEENRKALEKPKYTTCTISNVLNVIHSELERRKVLELAKEKASRYVFITIYEGDGTGISSETQTNMKMCEYFKEINDVFNKEPIRVKNRVIIVNVGIDGL